MPASSGNAYQMIGINGLPSTHGTYSYSLLDPATGVANLSDSADGSIVARLNFDTTDSGAYHASLLSNPGIFQEAQFELFSGRAPGSLAGLSVYCYVDDGYYPYASGGTFTFITSASGTTYSIVGDGLETLSSSGTFSYSTLNASAGRIQNNDSLAGASSTYLAFSGSGEGRFAIARSGVGFQIGHFVILDSKPPQISITSPASGARITDPTLNVQGTVSDDVEVDSVWYQINDGDWIEAYGTPSWTDTIDLTPGANVIRAYAIDTSGNTSPVVSVNFVYVQMAPLSLTTTGLGSVSPNLNGQSLEVGKTYTMTAKPAPGYVFSNWTGSVLTNTPSLSFVMQPNTILQANFIPNPFIQVAGNYQGLFYEIAGVANESSGFLSASVTSKGSFSAKLQMLGKSASFSGQFSAAGRSSASITIPGSNPLQAYLQLDTVAGDVLSGSIRGDTWKAQLTANRAFFNAKTRPAPQANNKYTLLIAGGDDSSAQPAGVSFGALTVDGSGNIKFRGSLSDGTPVAQNATVSKGGQWPFCVSLYSGKGSISGWLGFPGDTASDINGILSWTKSAQSSAKFYPRGFTNQIEAVGSLYTFANGIPVLNCSTGHVWLAGGNLSQSFTNRIGLGANNKLNNWSSNKLSFTLTSSSGLFKGSIVNPGTGQSISINGAVLQKRNIGLGYFLGTNQSGRVYFGQ